MGDRRKEVQQGMRNAFSTPEEQAGPGMFDKVMGLLTANPQPVVPVQPVDPSLEESAAKFFQQKKNRGY